MFRRLSWLLVGFILAGVLFFGLNAAFNSAQASLVNNSAFVSEVAWGGTAASASDEWIELYNNSAESIDISGWTLSDGDDVAILLSGMIDGFGFFLLERTNDDSIIDISADQVYIGALDDQGEILILRDHGGNIIDTANADDGQWPAGSGSPDFLSMERSARSAPDTDHNWVGNDTVNRNGIDADLNPINGTPKNPNSGWESDVPVVDLSARVPVDRRRLFCF